MFRDIGEKANLSGSLNNRAVLDLIQGRLNEARRILEELLPADREIGNIASIATRLGNQGERRSRSITQPMTSTSRRMHQGLSFVISAVIIFGTLTSIFFAKMSEAGATQAQGRAGTTVWDGAYTTDQAKRGEDAFMASCSACHAADLNGSPPLKGVQFMDNWREDTLGRIFTYMQTTMPRDGSRLPDAIYLDILAFILQENAFPPGAAELTSGTVETVRLIGKDGPRPLPSLATVLVVGCLTRDSSNAWILTNASEPVRTRNARETNEEELKASAAKPLGSQVFRLQNLQNSGFNPGFVPERHLGQKVQIKGVLVRQSNNDRINVTWPDVAGSSCVK